MGALLKEKDEARRWMTTNDDEEAIDGKERNDRWKMEGRKKKKKAYKEEHYVNHSEQRLILISSMIWKFLLLIQDSF